MSGSTASTVGIIAKDFVKKHPDYSTQALSRMMYNENRGIFKDIDHARQVIRYYRGAVGKRNFTKLKDKTNVRKSEDVKSCFKKLPEGLTTIDDFNTLKITGNHNIFIFGDTHIPYHSKKEMGIAVDWGKKQKSDLVIINGDFADHFSISRWQTDPRKRNFPEEIKVVKLGLEWLRSVFPKARIIYKMGNHEDRYENYMELRAPELLGVTNFDFKNIFELDKFKIELVKDKIPIKLNELFCIHGHEYKFNISNPVNPARGLYLRAKVNAICNHFHQSSSHSENDIQDKFTTTWSVGHLGDPHPKYMPLNKWNYGFATVETSGTKLFQVNNYKIIDGKVYNS